jgi:RNA polymerase sigma-70 factor (ECF subfamily)
LLSADAVLVLRCQEDDCEAFDEIVARYKDGIYNYVRRMISNRDDVEDLAQEVFVRAFASMKSFRRESNLRTWLYRIATNLCIDRYRRAGIEKQLIAPLEHERGDGEASREIDLPDDSHDPQCAFERTELQIEVQKALFKLPEKLRAAIFLYDMEGMPYDQIAETLGCPIGTVKSRIFNGRMQLRYLLRSYIEAI